MKNLAERLHASLLEEEEGVTLVEYGLVVALIAVVAIISVALLGDLISAAFNQVATVIDSAGG